MSMCEVPLQLKVNDNQKLVAGTYNTDREAKIDICWQQVCCG